MRGLSCGEMPGDRITVPADKRQRADRDPGPRRGQITSIEGIPALSLDAISSVAYGPRPCSSCWPPPAPALWPRSNR